MACGLAMEAAFSTYSVGKARDVTFGATVHGVIQGRMTVIHKSLSLSLPPQDLPLSQIFPTIYSLPASGLTPRTSRPDRFFWASPFFFVFSLFIGLFFFWFRAADLAGYPSAFRRTPSYRIASVHMHCVCNTVQLLWHDRLPFSWTMPPPTAPSWTHWLQHLWSHTAAWVWIASQKDWRNQGAPGSTMAMHWYSIWLIKCAFSCFSVLPGSAEAHVIWGGTVNHRFRLWYSRICAEKGR